MPYAEYPVSVIVDTIFNTGTNKIHISEGPRDDLCRICLHDIRNAYSEQN